MIVNRRRFKIASLLFTYLLFLAGDPGTAIAIPPPSNSSDIQAKLPWVRRQGASKAQGVIVFVHGVLGDDFTSWQNGSSYWPELLIHDQTFDGQDIYVYKYPSPKLGKSFSISEIADNLRLVLSTDGVLKYKQITFVSHSMGGLVTRDFIVKYQSQVVPKIRLLAFFATPTTGTPYARLGALISKNPQFGQMYPLESDNYLGTLQSNWLAGHFKIRSYCAYEVLPTFGQIIVDQASATNLCTEHLEPINANHIDIVKPQDAKSEAHRVLVSAFEETAQGFRSSLGRTEAIHEGPSRPLLPLIKEEIWSVLIPFNDGDGDAIPAFRMTQADTENFPPLGLFYKRISDWSKSALEGRDRPHTPEAINSFLEEIVRYHVFDWVDQLQHDRSSQSWDYRTGAKSNAILANAPPDFVEYPRSKVIALISSTPLGSVGDVMTYWRSRIDSFRVPANSTLQFLTNPENGVDAYRIQISAPSVFTLTLSVFHGVTLLNYGFVPPQFELTPETIKHTRSYDIVVKGRLEFKRFSDTDPLLQDEYVKWAEDLFAGVRNSMPSKQSSAIATSKSSQTQSGNKENPDISQPNAAAPGLVPAPQNFKDRVVQRNKNSPAGDRERLANAFYEFSQSLEEGRALMYKGFNEAAAIGAEGAGIAKDLQTHITKLRELAASAKEYGKSNMALRTKWDYYPEQTQYVFGDNPDNLGWGKLVNAFESYAFHLETWGAILNKDDQRVLSMLAEDRSQFETALNEFSLFYRGCKARLEEMKTSIQ